MSVSSKLSVLLLFFCSSALGYESLTTEVNFFSLMASPAKYKNRDVDVVGVLGLGYGREGHLYFSREQYEAGITNNAIKVILPKGFQCSGSCGKYYLLSGTVRVDNGGQLRFIDDVQYIVWAGNYLWPAESKIEEESDR
ncbi:hypothetical protein Misp06_00444 [Microbulbifer sp. NBRC 101763]|uniref:hypothetical protein n=1 Tax=Microbulbifer sp. NBRC 101763 TaxID=1113820 RepID=UPI0030B15E77